MTDKEWSTMVDLAENIMSSATEEYRVLRFDGGLSAFDRLGQALQIRRCCVEAILRLALSPENALGAAQRG